MGRTFALMALSALATGCYLRHGPSGDDPPPPPPPRFDAGPRADVPRVPPPPPPPPPPTRTVDLLLVIDNSMSMIEEQASLRAELPRMIDILTTGDFDQDGDLAGDGEPDDEDFLPVDELTVGIVTTDMGAGGHLIPTCDEPDFGDDGVLRSRGSGVSGCSTVYPPALTFRRGADAAAFAFNVGCLIDGVGTTGCGIEQPLESMLKALSPAAPQPWTAPEYLSPTFFESTLGHGDGSNAGFMHPGGVLAVIVVSDDDDCSARDPDLFDPASPDFDPGVNLRCFRYGAESLHEVDRYVDGLLQLRLDRRRLIFAPIVGVPVDLIPGSGAAISWTDIFADPRMIAREDPGGPTELVSSCSVPGRGVAYPPIRTLNVARSLESRGARVSLASICGESFTGVLTEIIDAL